MAHPFFRCGQFPVATISTEASARCRIVPVEILRNFSEMEEFQLKTKRNNDILGNSLHLKDELNRLCAILERRQC